MTAPLAPVIYGPIYPISPSLHVGGIFTGSLVEIRSSSDVLASITYTEPDSEPWLPFTKQPVEGDTISVTQTEPGGSPSTGGRSFQVIAVPDPLPNPIFSQSPHTCSDFIGLEALIPGAFITVQVHGTTIVHEQIQKPSQNFHLDPAVSFGVGDTFTAFQEAISKDIHLTSDVTELQPPVEDLGLKNPLPHPIIDPPAKACGRKATFNQLITGSSVYVTNQGRWYSQDGVTGPTQELKWTNFKNPWKEGPITAKQSFARCALTSDENKGTVSPADTVLAPGVPDGFCAKSQFIHLTGLDDPSELQIQRDVEGHPELSETRSRANGPAILDLPIPSDWSTVDVGAVSFSFLQKTDCGTSHSSSPVLVKKYDPSIPKPAILSPLFQCAKFIYVQHATVDFFIIVRSTDGTKESDLSDPIAVIQSDFFIHTDNLYRPLPKGQSILVYQFGGCGPDLKSDPVPVNDAPISDHNLPAPMLKTALRPGDQSMDIVNVVPGASVFAIVDGKYFTSSHLPWAPEVEAVTTGVTLKLTQGLALNQMVNPVQELCGFYSPLKASPAVVSLAKLTITATPATITKGAPTTIQVDAVDGETGAKNLPQWGSVSFNGLTFHLGDPVTVNIAAADSRASIAGSVAATGFNEAASFTINLANPPPPTFNLAFRGGSAAWTGFVPNTLEDETFSVQSVSWTATPQWDPSAATTVSGSRVAGQDYYAATKTFKRPPASAAGVSDFIDVTGTLKIAVTNNAVQTFSLVGRLQRPPSDTSAQSCIGWSWSFTVDPSSGVYQWPSGQTGNGPVTPFGFSC